MESREIRVQRMMAWERAKGELLSMKHTFWSDDTSEQYDEFNRIVDQFIDQVEDKELQC